MNTDSGVVTVGGLPVVPFSVSDNAVAAILIFALLMGIAYGLFRLVKYLFKQIGESL